MTAAWSWLDAHPGEVLSVTLFVGLMIAYFGGVALGWWDRPTRFVAEADDPQSEYKAAAESGYSVAWRERRRQAMECRLCTHAEDVYDQEAEPDRAVAALRAELDAWGSA